MPMRDWSPTRLYAAALAGLSLVSLGFLAVSILRGSGFGDWYLAWNLFLAWIPVVVAYFLVRMVRSGPWSDWPAISLSLAWLLFLPNAFYIVSDLIHLEDMPRTDVLYDSVMFGMFTITGLLLGFTSLYMVQSQLRRRLDSRRTAAIVSLLLLLCSFAIYLGRTLRWNSWDVLVSPAGILFDVSERIIDPMDHPDTFVVTATFFVFLGSLHWAGWVMLRAVRRSQTVDQGAPVANEAAVTHTSRGRAGKPQRTTGRSAKAKRAA